MDGEDELRIVLLGKSGVGKSSVENTILGETVFKAVCSAQSQTSICKRHEKEINGRRIVVIDTPGIFDYNRSEEELKKEIILCLVECAPGPHVFILVLEVTRHTKENQEAVEKLLEYFSDDVLSHMILLFTHGNDLDENIRIHNFINQSHVEGKTGKQTLKEFAKKCGNRFHVIDNKHWNKESKVSIVLTELKNINISDQMLQEITKKMQLKQTDETPWFSVLSDQADSEEAECQYESEEQEIREYRSNRFQLTQLMKTINSMTKINKESYKNKALEEIEEAIKEEVHKITEELMDEEENRDKAETYPKELVDIRRQAKERVRARIERKLAGVATGILVGALLGVGVGLAAPVVLVAGLIRAGWRKLTCQRPQAGGAPVERADVKAGITAASAGAAVGVTAEIMGATVAEAAVLGAGVGTGIGAVVGVGVCLLYGAGKGAMSGYKASKTSDNPNQTANKVAKALRKDAKNVLKACWNLEKPDAGDEAEEPLVQNN